MYELKQVPRAWYTCVDIYYIDKGFYRCSYEHALYVKTNINGDIIIVYLYVGVLVIFIGNNSKSLAKFKETMISLFETMNMGSMSYFLGIKVKHIDKGKFISQNKYANQY